MIKKLFRIFYDANKVLMNFYWLLGIKMAIAGTLEWFGYLMCFVSFTYFISALFWYLPRHTLPKVR